MSAPDRPAGVPESGVPDRDVLESGAGLPLSLHQAENLPPGFARATNVPVIAARFGAGLRPERLAHAFEAVLTRHEALRLRLAPVGGELRQLIAQPGSPILEQASLPGSLSDAELAAEFERVLSRRSELAADGPAVARLYRLDDGGYAGLFAVTHVAADGWSVGVLSRDIAQLYLGNELPELQPHYYRRYVRDQHALGAALTDRQAEFFASSLRGVPALPLRRPLPSQPAATYRSLRRSLPPADAHAVYELAGQLRTTPAKLLMAATLLALKSYFDQDSFSVLEVSAARGREQAHWAGLLSKAVPIPVLAADDLTAGQFVSQVHRHSLRALGMLGGPYSLKRVLTLLRDCDEWPAAAALHRRLWTQQPPTAHSVMFNCLTIAPPSDAPFGPGVTYRPLFPAEPLAPEKSRISDLDVLPLIDGASISLGITAHPAVHDDGDVERVLSSLERILTGWARGWDPDRRLGD
ncbi:MAG: condensation domain-containing protein [Jatrophihabitantaceae bacterium]